MGVEFAKPESDGTSSAAKTKPPLPVPKPACGQTWKRGQQKLCRVKEQEREVVEQGRDQKDEEEDEESEEGSEGESPASLPLPPHKLRRPTKIESVPLTQSTPKASPSGRIGPCDILYVIVILFLHRLRISTSLQATVIVIVCCTCASVGYGLAPRCDCFDCLRHP